jgi:hypothetical protein
LSARPRALLLTLALPLWGCSGDDGTAPAETGGTPWFEEAAAARGLTFQHDSGHRESFWMPEIMGGGVALLDADEDGDLDVYLVQSGSLEEPGAERGANQLFANDGRAHFRDISAASGAADRGYGMGAAVGDADGDGDGDLYVTNVGPDVLLTARGQARFEDTTGAARLGHPGWSTSATFFDPDRDGDLDLFVACYLDWAREAELTCMDRLGRPDYCSPRNYKTPARDVLYRNDGDGRFSDVSAESGVREVPGTGLGVATGDLDGDGLLDVFVANDGMPNRLWRNQGELRFEDVAMVAGCGVDANGLAKAGMGVTLVDLDDDLDLDVLVCNLKGESDSFYRNEGGWFSDHTATVALAAVSKPFTRFGLALADFDQDGSLDLYQANGRVERAPDSSADEANPYAEPNLLLRGVRSGRDTRFEPVQPAAGLARAPVATSRGLAVGDLDGDHVPDLVIVDRDGPVELLLGRAPALGAGLLVRALERSGRDALGAVLEIVHGAGHLRRDVGAGYGYLSSNDPRVHVGLGTTTEVERIVVRWVDGTRERFGPFPTAPGETRLVTLRRGEGQAP